MAGTYQEEFHLKAAIYAGDPRSDPEALLVAVLPLVMRHDAFGSYKSAEDLVVKPPDGRLVTHAALFTRHGVCEVAEFSCTKWKDDGRRRFFQGSVMVSRLDEAVGFTYAARTLTRDIRVEICRESAEDLAGWSTYDIEKTH